MAVHVAIEIVQPRKLAAVRRHVPIGAVASAWRPALDQVWAFLRTQPGLRTDGHNIFLYHHPARRTDPMDVDFGVEVARSFAPSGEVCETNTPSGEAAIAVHHGPYDQLRATHDAIHQWAISHDKTFAGLSWQFVKIHAEVSKYLRQNCDAKVLVLDNPDIFPSPNCVPSIIKGKHSYVPNLRYIGTGTIPVANALCCRLPSYPVLLLNTASHRPS